MINHRLGIKYDTLIKHNGLYDHYKPTQCITNSRNYCYQKRLSNWSLIDSSVYNRKTVKNQRKRRERKERSILNECANNESLPPRTPEAAFKVYHYINAANPSTTKRLHHFKVSKYTQANGRYNFSCYLPTLSQLQFLEKAQDQVLALQSPESPILLTKYKDFFPNTTI